MKQIVSKGGQIYCETTVPYPPETVKAMKKAGYTVKDVPDEEPAEKKGRKKKSE